MSISTPRYLASFHPKQVSHFFTDIRNSLKSLMWRACGLRRDADGLAEAAENVAGWRRYVLSRQFSNPIGWELQDMLTVAGLMIEAAPLRTETRGGHVRTDHPDQDDEHWTCHIAFHRDGARPSEARPERLVQSRWGAALGPTTPGVDEELMLERVTHGSDPSRQERTRGADR